MFKARISPETLRAGDEIKEKLEQAIFAANLDLENALKDPAGPFFTPIDLGYARAFWWGAVDGSPSSHPNPPAKDKPVPTPPPDLDVIRRSVGRVFNLRNGAAYIGRLEEGHSPQNRGFVAGAANAYDDFLQARIAEAKGRGGS